MTRNVREACYTHCQWTRLVKFAVCASPRSDVCVPLAPVTLTLTLTAIVRYMIVHALFSPLYRWLSLGCSWVAFPCDSEHISPAWMLMPVGNLVGAVTAKPVSEDYLEWGWFLFGVGLLLWLALWPTTFQKVYTQSVCFFGAEQVFLSISQAAEKNFRSRHFLPHACCDAEN